MSTALSRAYQLACGRFERPEKFTRWFTAGASARVRGGSHLQSKRDTNQRCFSNGLSQQFRRNLLLDNQFRHSLPQLSRRQKRALLRRGFLSGSSLPFFEPDTTRGLTEHAGRDVSRRFAFIAFPRRVYAPFGGWRRLSGSYPHIWGASVNTEFSLAPRMQPSNSRTLLSSNPHAGLHTDIRNVWQECPPNDWDNDFPVPKPRVVPADAPCPSTDLHLGPTEAM
jgi:hypothetical protein